MADSKLGYDKETIEGSELARNIVSISDDVLQLVNFTIAGEQYGIPILDVHEIIRMPMLTRLPRTPSFIKGVINLRGKVIPVIDLRERFGFETRKYTHMTRIIVAGVEGKLVGMVVDSVTQVIRVPKNLIEPPPPIIGGITGDYLTGVAKYEDKLVILLDLKKILTEEEIKEIERINKE